MAEFHDAPARLPLPPGAAPAPIPLHPPRPRSVVLRDIPRRTTSPRARDATPMQNVRGARGIARRYEVAQDVFYADRAPEADISIVRIAREVVSGIKRGADVTNVNLPASVLDPVSSLEKGMKSMQRGELLPLIARAPTPQARFLAALRFYFSGLSKERFGKKPYNPVLGEVFRAGFMHRGGAGKTVLIAEQVSHHPPITAMHLYNSTLGFRMNSYAAPEPRFWGNSVEVKLRGCIRLYLEEHEEEYESTRPQMVMSGFFAGRHRLEFIGSTTVTCVATHLSAHVDFKGKGLLGRNEMNAVSGQILDTRTNTPLYTFSGAWDGIINITELATNTTTVLFDYEQIVRDYSMVAVLPPECEREPSFSSVVWAECSKAIWDADSLNANAAKRRVEDAARAALKERQAKGKEWIPHYFETRLDGRDGYQLRPHLRSQLGPDVVPDKEQLAIMAEVQKFDAPELPVDHLIVKSSMLPKNGRTESMEETNGLAAAHRKRLIGRSKK